MLVEQLLALRRLSLLQEVELVQLGELLTQLMLALLLLLKLGAYVGQLLFLVLVILGGQLLLGLVDLLFLLCEPVKVLHLL